jgi:hypothetical protein
VCLGRSLAAGWLLALLGGASAFQTRVGYPRSRSCVSGRWGAHAGHRGTVDQLRSATAVDAVGLQPLKGGRVQDFRIREVSRIPVGITYPSGWLYRAGSELWFACVWKPWDE